MNTRPYTATDAGLFAPQTHARTGDRFAEGSYFVFLLLIFIGLQPFAVRDTAALAGGPSALAGAGDTFRQIAFLGAFALIVVSAFGRAGAQAFKAVPLTLVALLLWCMVSAAWATEPDVSFRRAVLAVVIALSAMIGASAAGPERALVLLRSVLAGVLIVNLVSIAFVPQAVHLAGEADPGLVGDWRGLYFHKNIAGSVTAISAIVFLFSFLESKRLSEFLLFAGAVFFAIMTRSKSSIGLLPLALALGLIYRAAWKQGIDRSIAGISLALLVVIGLAVAVLDWNTIARVFEDPTQFTGRTAIWQGEIAYIGDHPLLGSGFGTFADTGALSPLHDYVGAAWVQNEAHGHNAYLQLFVTIGGIGFALAMLALVFSPLRQFLGDHGARLGVVSLLFAIFVFMIPHEALESDFLEGDSPAWVAFLIALSALRGLRADARRQAAEGMWT